MGTRRVRIIRRIIFIILISMQFLNAGFQIKTIPENCFYLSANKGMSAINLNQNIFNNINFHIIKYPQNINFLKLNYNKFSFAVLDYGVLTNQINNQVLDEFRAYEFDLQYYIQKPILNKILLHSNIGVSYSKIGAVDSYALTSKIKATTSLPDKKINFALQVNNLGIIINDYTKANTNLPLELQYGITYQLKKTDILLGYDFIYEPYFLDKKHIFNIQFPIKKIAQINLSNTSYRKNLSSSNFENDWFYGLGLGLSIKSSTIKANIGMNNLGDAGFVYGISIKKTL